MSRLPVPDGKVRIVPSLLAADFADLAGALKTAETAGAVWASMDVMDGHFVPNLSFGPGHLKALRPRTQMALDAHLMVSDPQRFAPMFAEAGADLVVLHLETCPAPQAMLRELRGRGVSAGLAINPGTAVDVVLPHLGEADLVLVMTVEPGFGGQEFRKDMLPKLRRLRKAVSSQGLKTWIMVDGGIGPETSALAADAGADAMVAGTSFYRAKDPRVAYLEMSKRAQEAFEHRRN